MDPMRQKNNTHHLDLASSLAVVAGLYLAGIAMAGVDSNGSGGWVLRITIVVTAFWISLRTLLRRGAPPAGIIGAILFAVHLLNLFILIICAGYIFVWALKQK